MTGDQLRIGARAILGRDLSTREAASIDNYLKLLSKWQRVHRLAGSADRDWAIANVVLDSLLFLRALPGLFRPEDTPRTILDLGSGAGIPGVPLAIVRPEIEFILAESRQRRVSFLSEVVRSLPLPNARVFAGRVEVLAQDAVRQVDAVVVRCAGDPSTVAPLARRLVRPGGSIIISGPPEPIPIAEGTWVKVHGTRSGRERLFLVVAC